MIDLKTHRKNRRHLKNTKNKVPRSDIGYISMISIDFDRIFGDFDISFVKDLSLEDGAATLTDFTATTIAQGIKIATGIGHPNLTKWLVCGGGRKNKHLMDCVIKKGPEYLKTDDPFFNEKLDDLKTISLEPVEKYEIDGDFVESQAFAYLAIRSYLKLPISFPSTTCCKEEYGCTGGIIIKNF